MDVSLLELILHLHTTMAVPMKNPNHVEQLHSLGNYLGQMIWYLISWLRNVVSSASCLIAIHVLTRTKHPKSEICVCVCVYVENRLRPHSIILIPRQTSTDKQNQPYTWKFNKNYTTWLLKSSYLLSVSNFLIIVSIRVVRGATWPRLTGILLICF